ncbi:hypothetical protein AAVH_34713 [Aphelenchoides avenae]|nr:hypothetical protein AAVH_34713 [Aphelenchus avenae]
MHPPRHIPTSIAALILLIVSSHALPGDSHGACKRDRSCPRAGDYCVFDECIEGATKVCYDHGLGCGQYRSACTSSPLAAAIKAACPLTCGNCRVNNQGK